MHAVAEKLNTLKTELNERFLERKDATLAMILAVLSGEHVFLLGPPGTAKSEEVRAIVHAIINSTYFEVPLSKTRPAEAVLGPLDILEFREKGNYFLKREGYATKVDFAFLDEIGKMSPVLGHDLLALLNERVYHEVTGGLSVHQSPLSTAFCASNELITDESDDAAALWDRLLFRVYVDYLQNRDNFATLLTSEMAPIETTIDWKDLREAIAVEVPEVTLGQAGVEALVKLREEMRRESMHVSDRRWRASRKALQANAFLHGRTEVNEDDIAVLRFTLWETPEQIEKITRLVMSASNPFVEPLLNISDSLVEVDLAITERSGDDANGNSQETALKHYAKEGAKKLGIARDQLDALLIQAEGRSIPGFKNASDEHLRILKRVFTTCLEQSEEEAEVFIQKRLGSGDGGNV